MIKTFHEEVKKKFPNYAIHKLGNTKHSNVLQLSKEGKPNLIAKTIWHDIDDPEGVDMGIKVKDKAYVNESLILHLRTFKMPIL